MPYVKGSPYEGVFRCSNVRCISSHRPFPMKDKWKASSPIILIDEVEDFESNLLCHKCNHLLYFNHRYDRYEANDKDAYDIMVFQCMVEGCDCIAITSVYKETNFPVMKTHLFGCGMIRNDFPKNKPLKVITDNDVDTVIFCNLKCLKEFNDW